MLKKYTDTINTRFGKLIVISIEYEKGQYYSVCKCDCGNTKRIRSSSLFHGYTKSCGCSNKIILSALMKKHLLIGDKFNLLTIIEELPNKNHRTMYKCLCDCGKETIASGTDLRRNTKKSCGCLIVKHINKLNKNTRILAGCDPDISMSTNNMRIRNDASPYRRMVFKRDNFKCQLCGCTGKINAHHIKPISLFPELACDITNIITLCVECHKKAHNNHFKQINVVMSRLLLYILTFSIFFNNV